MIHYLVFLGVFINIIFSIPYILETISGNTKPNRVTWFLWSVAPLIAFFASISNGFNWSSLPVFISGFMPFVIFCVSFINKDSYWRLEKFDYLCGVFSVLALLLWAITNQPVIAITFAILSDFFAAIPTLKKSWKNPETENISAYIGGLLSALSGLVIVKSWSFSEAAFLIYLVVITTVFIFFILRKRFISKSVKNI